MLTLRQSPFDLFNQLEQQLASAERVPAAEIVEHEEAYTVRLELPGVDKGSIDIKATDRTLVITAERTKTKTTPESTGSDDDKTENPGHEALLSEFRYGTWSRSFRFPQALDREQLKAVFKDGVLEITAGKTRSHTTVSVAVEN